jgi:hypothetical protein
MTNLSRFPAPALVLCALWCTWLTPLCNAQFTTVINVPPDLELDRIEPGTQVNVFAGGVLSSRNPIEMEQAELNIEGATLNEAVVARNHASINVRNGHVENAYSLSGSQLTLRDGTAGVLGARSGGEIVVSESSVWSVFVGFYQNPLPFPIVDDGPLTGITATFFVQNSEINWLNVDDNSVVNLTNTHVTQQMTGHGGTITAENSQLRDVFLGPPEDRGEDARGMVAHFHSSQAKLLRIQSRAVAHVHDTNAERVQLIGSATLHHYGGHLKDLYMYPGFADDPGTPIANIYGGTISNPGGIRESYRFFDGIINLYGGAFELGASFAMPLHWHGGSVGPAATLRSDVYIYGTEFALLQDNGFEPITGLTADLPELLTLRDATLRIRRADGSIYDAVLSSQFGLPDIYVAPGAKLYLVLVQVPEPATITLTLVALSGLTLLHRHRWLFTH